MEGISDIFRTRWERCNTASVPGCSRSARAAAGRCAYADRLKDPQLVRVVFAYRFGKMDLNLFKRKDLNNQGVQDAGSSMGGQ